MLSFLKENPKLSPVLILRFGLGLTFLYASLHMLFDPASWVGFIPQWVGGIIAPNVFLLIHSIFELLVSVLLLLGIFLPAVSFLAFLDFVAILLLYGVDDLTFRDFGLALAALALFALSLKGRETS
ncbi:MAG: DoxX family membrane protein [Minisyncoccia bacterium]|jgi:uncharacterized membrane protein YphA (DoxX/SURF4 family)